jgi:hypothetical protein
MKTTLFLGLIICLLIGSSATQVSTFPQGAWKWVSAKHYSEGKLISDVFPGMYKGSGVKIWSKTHVNDIGKFQNDTSTINLYFGGTYKLEGKRYEENIIYHFHKEFVGQIMKGLLELRNDTLIQTNGVDEKGKLEKTYDVMKFVRAE